MKQILRVLLVVLAAHFQLSAQYCITGVGPSNTFDSDIEDVTLIGDNYSFSNLASCPGVVVVDD